MVTPGHRYRRVEPIGDEWDALVVVGVFQDEVTVQPASFGPVISVEIPSLLEHYTRELPDPAAGLREALASATKAWETPISELTHA